MYQSDEELRRRAQKRADEKAGFIIHLGAYVAVNLFLVAIWYFTSNGGTFPWFIIILFGWGIGIIIHFTAAFVSPGYTDRLAEKEYRRLKGLK